MKSKITTLFLSAAFLAGDLFGQTGVPAAATAPAPAVLAPEAAPNRIVYSPRLPRPAELVSVANAQGRTVEKMEQTSYQITATYKDAAGRTEIVAYVLLPNGASLGVPASVSPVATPPPPTAWQPAPLSVLYPDGASPGAPAAAPAPAAPAAPAAPVAPPPPPTAYQPAPPTVIYQSVPSQVIYYDTYPSRYYYPGYDYYYPYGLAIGLGIGFHDGFRGGFFRGGFRR